MADWHVRVIDSPEVARTLVEPLAAADPVAYSVVAGTVKSLGDDPGRYPSFAWFALARGGAVEIVAMHTEPMPIYLPCHAEGGSAALAASLRDTGYAVPGANGDRSAVEEFTPAYLDGSGQQVTRSEGIGVFALDGPPVLPWPVSGEHRLAGPEHRELVTGWTVAFGEETGHGALDPEGTVARFLDRGRLHLWLADGEPVAMCWVNLPQAGYVRVSGVYTPPDLRGHGYASAVVETASRLEQRAGHQCMLHTQLDNPTSNDIYRAMGYRQVGEHLHTIFG